jgi:hypothetical protein
VGIPWWCIVRDGFKLISYLPGVQTREGQMTLGQKQRLFTRLVSLLIEWAYENGYEITLGDAYRDPRVFGSQGEKKGYGRSRSNHKIRLAIDLNLFKDGQYLTETEDHRPLGEYWESLHDLCEWGGKENRNDGNHYSMNHDGKW